MNISALIAILFSSLTPLSTVMPKEADQPITKPAGDRVGFTASIDGVETDLSIISTSVMPGETVSLSTSAALTIPDGTPLKTETGWQWIAPETPGHHVLHLRKGGEMMLVNVFVLTPFRNGRDENLNGYRVGQYSDQPLRGLPQYLPPTGFINMQPGMEDIQIAPNFKLGQFICKQQPGHDPTFLLVQAHMLTKLERLLEAANDKGWEADTFYVMSGFRTPFYNAAIGNTTTSSRHLFGDAAEECAEKPPVEVRDHDADVAGAAGCQARRRRGDDVSEALRCLLHAFPCRIRHVVLAAERPRHRGRGHPGRAGYLIDTDHHDARGLLAGEPHCLVDRQHPVGERAAGDHDGS